jgi:ubiquinol-cytochrome c reductase cytochrome b subunit
LVVIHLSLLHLEGSSNPLGVCTKIDKVGFYPYFYLKDLFGFICFLLLFSYFLFFEPNLMGHPDNYIRADALITPTHIVPE